MFARLADQEGRRVVALQHKLAERENELREALRTAVAVAGVSREELAGWLGNVDGLDLDLYLPEEK